MKRGTWVAELLALTLLSVVVVGCDSEGTDAASLRIAVVSQVEIEPIAQLREGFRDQIESRQPMLDVDLTEFNALGQPALYPQVVDQVIAGSFDLVYVLGTPMAQAIQRRSPTTLLVQGAATDPVSSGLADSWLGSGRQYAATSDQISASSILDGARTVAGDAGLNKIGVILNSSEANSTATLKAVSDAASEDRLVVEAAPVANAADVASGLQRLVQAGVDVIFVPQDNTVFEALEVVGRICQQNEIPWYSTSKAAEAFGARMTLGVDYYSLGSDSADIAMSILLDGADPGSIPIRRASAM